MALICDCSTDFGDAPSCSVVKTRRARKEHKCCECHGLILPGSRYEYTSGIWDGDPMDFKTCLTCVAIREQYCPRSWVYGMLAESIHECLGFDYRKVEED